MTKPRFDEVRILDWLVAYVAAVDEADQKSETVRVRGFRAFKVCPLKDRKKDVGDD